MVEPKFWPARPDAEVIFPDHKPPRNPSSQSGSGVPEYADPLAPEDMGERDFLDAFGGLSHGPRSDDGNITKYMSLIRLRPNFSSQTMAVSNLTVPTPWMGSRWGVDDKGNYGPLTPDGSIVTGVDLPEEDWQQPQMPASGPQTESGRPTIPNLEGLPIKGTNWGSVARGVGAACVAGALLVWLVGNDLTPAGPNDDYNIAPTWDSMMNGLQLVWQSL